MTSSVTGFFLSIVQGIVIMVVDVFYIVLVLIKLLLDIISISSFLALELIKIVWVNSIEGLSGERQIV